MPTEPAKHRAVRPSPYRHGCEKAAAKPGIQSGARKRFDGIEVANIGPRHTRERGALT